jgi:hypothetical protein
MSPEIEDNHFSAVIAQLKAVAVDVIAHDLGGDVADLSAGNGQVRIRDGR